MQMVLKDKDTSIETEAKKGEQSATPENGLDRQKSEKSELELPEKPKGKLQADAVPAYDGSRELDKYIADLITGKSENRPNLIDCLLRIAQEAGREGFGQNLSDEKAYLIKKDVFAMADRVVTQLSADTTAKGSALSNTEIAESVNKVFFNSKNGFKPADATNFLVAQSVGTFADTWDSKKGICEDLAGAYLAVTEIANKKGANIPATAARAPGHIFIRMGSGDDAVFVELTASGDIRTAAQYQEKLGVAPSTTPKADSEGRGTPVVSELLNCAISLSQQGNEKASREFFKLATSVDKASPETIATIVSQELTQGMNASTEAKEQHFRNARHYTEVLEKLDPETRLVPYLRALTAISAGKDGDVKLQMVSYDRATKEIEKALEMPERRQVTAFSPLNTAQLHLQAAAFYREKYALGGEDSDLNSAIAHYDKVAEKTTSEGIRQSMTSWKAGAYAEAYQLSKNDKHLSEATKGFKEIINSDTQNFIKAGSYSQLAELQRSAGKFDEAISNFKELKKLQVTVPGEAMVDVNIGVCLASKGSTVEAGRYLSSGLKAFGLQFADNISDIRSALPELRTIHEEGPSFRRAVEELGELAKEISNNPTLSERINKALKGSK